MTIKTNIIESRTTNGDLTIRGDGTGVPDIEAGFKVGGAAGVPVSALRAGTDGELVTWDASGDPATVAVGTSTHVLTSNGAGAAPTFQAAGGGGAWNLIGTAETSGSSSTLSISGLSSTYDTYAIAVTDFAPFSIAVAAALQIVPAVSIISSMINTCFSFRSPTRFATSA